MLGKVTATQATVVIDETDLISQFTGYTYDKSPVERGDEDRWHIESVQLIADNGSPRQVRVLLRATHKDEEGDE